jgi:hypothetical protein
MALIKSALELALEKTKDLTVDEATLEAGRLRQEGKRLIGRYLEDPEGTDLAKAIAEQPKEKRQALKAGMLDSLESQLQMPTGEAGMGKLEAVAAGYAALASGGAGLLAGPAQALAEKKVQATFQQLAGFFRQYLDDMKNVEQVIRKQWGPKLREKERQMSARMGQDVRLDPMMDQEFAAFYKQNVGAVREQYQAALDRAKAELAAALGIPRD